MFVTGQKIVCVNPGPWENNPLKKGSIYTVVSQQHVFVYLVETPPESGWFASRFKPLEENKTDISVFKKILNLANNKVLEGA